MSKQKEQPRRENRVEAELMLDPTGRLDEIAIVVRTVDGADLTSQEILDAVSDMLIDEPAFTGEEFDDPHFDA